MEPFLRGDGCLFPMLFVEHRTPCHQPWNANSDVSLCSMHVPKGHHRSLCPETLGSCVSPSPGTCCPRTLSFSWAQPKDSPQSRWPVELRGHSEWPPPALRPLQKECPLISQKRYTPTSALPDQAGLPWALLECYFHTLISISPCHCGTVTPKVPGGRNQC